MNVGYHRTSVDLVERRACFNAVSFNQSTFIQTINIMNWKLNNYFFTLGLILLMNSIVEITALILQSAGQTKFLCGTVKLTYYKCSIALGI